MDQTSKITNRISIYFRTRIPVLLWGPPGVGKTAYLEHFAKKVGRRLIVPTVRAPEDIAVPVTLPDGSGVEVLPVNQFIEAVNDPHAIVFIDEITTLAPAVQAAALRFLDSGMVGGKRIPSSVWRVAAANPPEQAAGGWDLAPPTANRLAHIQWKLDPMEWAEQFPSYWGDPPQVGDLKPEVWSQARSIVAGFIRARPTLLLQIPKSIEQQGRAWPSPRSWDHASRAIAAVLQENLPMSEATPYVMDCIGEATALEFAVWIHDLDLPNPEDLLANPKKFQMPKRGDQIYAVLAAVAAAVVHQPTQKRWEAGWKVLSAAAEQGAADIAAAAARTLVLARKPGWPAPREAGKFAPLLKAAGLL